MFWCFGVISSYFEHSEIMNVLTVGLVANSIIIGIRVVHKLWSFSQRYFGNERFRMSHEKYAPKPGMVATVKTHVQFSAISIGVS